MLLFEVILLSLTLLLFLFFMFCCFVAHKITHPRTYKYEDTYKREVDEGKIVEQKFKCLEKEEVYIESSYGYKIHGLYFPNNNSKKAIILCHGISWTLYGSIKYIEMFLKRGFSVLVYDHRNHGLSGGRDTSFGYYEKFDLKKCTDWLINKLGKDAVIGLLGESMGAGTALQNIAIDSRIKFCIADCGYSDIFNLFKYHLVKDYKIKRIPLVEITSIITKLIRGWSFKDVSPIQCIADIATPVLFTHGETDDFVPTWMSEEMYKAKKGYKDLYIAPNAAHVEAYWSNIEEYEGRVEHFLKEIGIITDQQTW
jgi:uncharacterized protein